MTPDQERDFNRRAEQMLQGHRPAPDGRDYRAFVFSEITAEDRDNYRKNFDRVFPDAPGAGI